MLTMQPTLLIGPSDWDAERMPRQEFARRIDVLWQHESEASRAIVFGNRHHHGELAYLTNFVPKLEPAVALLSRSGAHRLFVGSPNMIGAARPLTFIENVSPIQDMAGVIARDPQRSLIIGADYMPATFRQAVTEAIGASAPAADATANVWSRMRGKSRHELDAIDAAVKTTGVARKAMREALISGAGVTKVILAGEAAAIAAGAQDVRTLFSLDGGRTLRPFFVSVEQAADPLMAYLAVRRFNYWSECFPLFRTRAEPSRLYEQAWEAMKSALSAIKAGVATHDIAQQIAAALAPYQVHPMIARAFAQRMGLALDEPSRTDIGASFEAGEVYSLRIGAVDGSSGGMICSGMIHVTADGVERFDDGQS
ncbi:MAG TPA: M24 family metallopeptidase [Xanthobacteraceae bacterium]